jgi:digeranylgeranylglycerophospholipid reductase
MKCSVPQLLLPIVDPEICLTCRACVGLCPSSAIKQLRREIDIDYSKCNSCGLCGVWCPAKAISFNSNEPVVQKIDLRRVNAPQHLDKIFDIIIVGGGIAGLSTAIGALKRKPDLKVLILDKKRKIGEDVNSSAGTWYFTLDMLPLTQEERSEIVLRKFIKFGLSVEKESVVLDIGKIFLETMDLSHLQEVLSDKLLIMGAQIETNSFVDSLEKIDEGFTIYVTSKGAVYPLRSKLLVDSSGIDSSISRKLGYHKSWDPNVIGVGAEYEMTWEGDPSIIWFVRMKHRNLGYAWSFPVDKKKSRVGIAGLLRAFKNNDIPIQDELDIFLDSHFLVKQNTNNKISRINFKCGAYPMIRMEDRIISDKALRVGDAASQANPILGEGIYYAIKYGLKAGEILANAKTGSIEELKPYEDYVLKDSKKFEEDKLGYKADYDAMVRKLNEIKDKLSDEEKWALLSFIMPLESSWSAKLSIATKLLGYSETMKLFGSVAKRKIGKIF